jgi:hypothetical protein
MKKELDNLSECIKITVPTTYPSVFNKPEVIVKLERLHEEYVWLQLTKLVIS